MSRQVQGISYAGDVAKKVRSETFRDHHLQIIIQDALYLPWNPEWKMNNIIL